MDYSMFAFINHNRPELTKRIQDLTPIDGELLDEEIEDWINEDCDLYYWAACEGAFDDKFRRESTSEDFYAVATRKYQCINIEILDGQCVDTDCEGGVWVQARVWVSDEDIRKYNIGDYY